MAWDPYDHPNSPPERHDHRVPVEPVKGRAVAGVLVGIMLLAIVLSIAANAQETKQTGSESQAQQTEQQAQEQQTQEQQTQEQQTQEQQTQEQQTQEQQAQGQQQEQSGATSSMQAQPEAQAAEAKPLEGQIVEQAEGTYVASDLIGQPVMTAEGEEMGQIADLLVSEDNRLAGAIIGIGGFLGFGEKRIAVEFDRIQRVPTQEGGEQLALNFTRAELEQAPEFVSLAEQRRQQEAQQQQMQQQPASEGQSLTQ